MIALGAAVRYLSERLMGCYKKMVASSSLVLAHFSKEVVAGVVAFLRPLTSEIFKKSYRILLFSVLFGANQLAGLSAHAATNWADWTSIGTDTTASVGGPAYNYATTALGTLQDASTSATANLSHTGEVITGSLCCGSTSLTGFTGWTDAGTYYPAASFIDPNGNVGSPAAPVNADILMHAGYSVASAKIHTITFDREVSGIVMAIWSLGGANDAVMRFSDDFQILSTASGTQPGGNGIVKGTDSSSGYTVTGGPSYGYNGTIQFYGTFGPSRPLQYTVTAPEYYFGMNIASTSVALSGSGGSSVALTPTMTITASEVSDGDTSADATLSLTFTSSKATSNFAVGDIAVTNGTISNFASTSSTVYTATFTPAAAGATTIDVAAGAFTDSDGNNNMAATQFNWTYTNDATAPTLSSAAVSSSGTSLVITASETLDTSSVPAASSFTVATDGSATTVTGVGVSSNQVTLTLGQTIGTGQSVSVAYTAPASNPLKDTAGNLLPSFGATSTTNSSTQTVQLPSPVTKEAVVQGVKAQEKITSRASNFAMTSIGNRLDWIRINPSATQRSYQGIKLRFANPIVNSIVNANYAPTKLEMDDVFGFGRQLADGASASSLLKSKVDAELVNQLGRIKSQAGLNLNVNPTGDAIAGRWSGWTYGEIIVGDHTSDTNLITKIRAKNLAFGADRPTDEEGLIGFAVTLGKDEETIESNGSALDAKLFSLAGYRSDPLNSNLTLTSTLGYTRMNFNTKRLDGSQTLTGKRLGDQIFAEVTLNPVNKSSEALKITPFGKGSIVYSSLRPYSEQGGSYALFYARQVQSMATLSVGVDASYETYYQGGRVLPSLGFEYGSSRKYGKGGSVRYLSETTVYLLEADQAKTESLQLRLGIDYQKKNGHSLNVTLRRTLRTDQTRLTALRLMYTLPLN